MFSKFKYDAYALNIAYQTNLLALDTLSAICVSIYDNYTAIVHLVVSNISDQDRYLPCHARVGRLSLHCPLPHSSFQRRTRSPDESREEFIH